MNYYNHGQKGVHPIGIQRLIETSPQTNNPSLYIRSSVPFMYGVIVLRKAKDIGIQMIDNVINIFRENYPVVNNTSRFGVITLQTQLRDRGQPKSHMSIRGHHVIGDVLDLSKFWSHLYSGKISLHNYFDIEKCAVCWTGYSVDTSQTVAYMDLDEYSKEKYNDKSLHEMIEKRFLPAITLAQNELQTNFTGDKVRSQILFCARETEKGLTKFSLHVHFWNTLVNPKHFKLMLQNIQGVPKRLVWEQDSDGEWFSKEDEKNTIFDTAVYGGQKQLFRGPCCGKNGENAILRAVEFHLNENDQWTIQRTQLQMESKSNEELEEVYEMEIFHARITSPHVNGSPIGFSDLSKYEDYVKSREQKSHNLHSLTITTSVSFITDDLESFLRPIVNYELIPHFLQFRKRLQSALGAYEATVPIDFDTTTVKNEVSDNCTHIRYIHIQQDTFCETDSKHFHSKQKDSPIRYGIDLFSCTIWQYCFACGHKGRIYQWLHNHNHIAIKPLEESQWTKENLILPPHGAKGYQFLLDYFRDRFVYNLSQGNVYVYSEKMNVWTDGPLAHLTLGTMVDAINKKYEAYKNDHTSIKVKKNQLKIEEDDEMTRPEKKKELKKVIQEARKFLRKNSVFINVSANQRSKILDDIRSFTIHMSVTEMNPCYNLIPMRDGRCYDVFTGSVSPCEKHQLFTSLLNITLTDNEEEISIVNTWFEQISTGNSEKMSYLKKIAAYMLTHLMHDRMFYVLKGTGKNGKSLFKEMVLKCADGALGTSARFKNMNQQYWEKKANSNTGAEQASPESYMVIGKSVLSTDDIEQTTLDAGKIKRMVAGEQISGRPLYGAPQVIVPKAKILWTTNHTPLLNGNDNALWERFALIDFQSKWVKKQEEVQPDMYRFLQDSEKYQSIMKMTDAFFTVCSKELTKYYTSLQSDPVTGRPSTLTPFTTPPKMEKLKAEARAQQLPLADFIQKHTTDVNPYNMLDCTPIDVLFDSYLAFLDNNNEVKLRRQTTKADFHRQMVMSLEIKTLVINNETFVCVKLTERVQKKPRLDERISHDRDF